MATIKGGEKAAAYIHDLAQRIGSGGYVKVGFLAGATYPNGKPVALVAFWNEYGGSGPARPFFRNMIADKSDGWGPALGKNLVDTNYDVERTLDRMGAGIKGQLQTSILELWEPPLAPSTVKRKGFDKPLIETSHMINSADYRVGDKGANP